MNVNGTCGGGEERLPQGLWESDREPRLIDREWVKRISREEGLEGSMEAAVHGEIIVRMDRHGDIERRAADSCMKNRGTLGGRFGSAFV